MAIAHDGTIPDFDSALTEYSSISLFQEQISRVEGFNVYLCDSDLVVIPANKVSEDLTYDRWGKAAPGNMKLQRWFEIRASKVLDDRYSLFAIYPNGSFVPWDAYLSDIRDEYRYQLVSGYMQKRANYEMLLAYNIQPLILAVRIRCASKDMAAKLRLHLHEKGFALDLASGEEKVSTGFWWWQYQLVPSFTLEYRIRVRGYASQVAGISSRMKEYFSKFSAKFSTEAIDVYSFRP